MFLWMSNWDVKEWHHDWHFLCCRVRKAISKREQRENTTGWQVTSGQNFANILQGNFSRACNVEPSFASLILNMEVIIRKHQRNKVTPLMGWKIYNKQYRWYGRGSVKYINKRGDNYLTCGFEVLVKVLIRSSYVWKHHGINITCITLLRHTSKHRTLEVTQSHPHRCSDRNIVEWSL